MDLKDEVDGLRRRFRSLASGEMAEVPGAYELAAGLEKMVIHLGGGDVEDDERLAMVVQGLRGLADFLESGEATETPANGAPSSPPTGMEQFVETFRKEAQKRLQGLSIAMMGIFGSDANDAALKQSADHLHAIRGGAAMVGINGVADLSGAMEDFLKRMGLVEQAQRQWPTKTLLRGYAVLEKAVHAEELQVDSEEAVEIVKSLRDAVARLQADNEEESTGQESSEPETDSGPGPMQPTAAPRPAPAPAPAAATATKLEQPILIVDDMETIAASVAFILAELDVPIEIASHGEEAMKLLQDQPFSLVVSDVDMPRMDGIALTRMIRATDELMQLPVILLTSLDHPEERQAGLDAGANDYIIKGSIGGGELVGRVRELLEVAPVVQRDVAPQKRRILVAEDTETVAASIAFVLSEGPYEITLATDGKDARRKLDAHVYDLLITDMQMPYMSGIELVADLRGDEELMELPVVMLTSVQDDELIAEAREAGVDRYLIKGEIAGGKLLNIVEDLLGTGAQ